MRPSGVCLVPGIERTPSWHSPGGALLTFLPFAVFVVPSWSKVVSRPPTPSTGLGLRFLVRLSLRAGFHHLSVAPSRICRFFQSQWLLRTGKADFTRLASCCTGACSLRVLRGQGWVSSPGFRVCRAGALSLTTQWMYKPVHPWWNVTIFVFFWLLR